jgi:hypothetical protein
MAAGDPTVTVYFDIPQHDPLLFVLDDPVQGELDSAFVLGGDLPTDITSYVQSYRIVRGRARELDEIVAGTAFLTLQNTSRDLDPLNASGPFAGNIVPAKRITIAVEDTVIFDGRIDDWSFDWTVDRQALAYISAVDALGQLARIDFDEWTATASQTAGPRITAALDRSEVAFGANRDIDTGVSTLQGDLITWGSNVLNYLQLVSRSDLGRLFASREGVLTFRDRHSALNPGGGSVILADDGTGIPYSLIGTAYGVEFLFNKVGVDREGGTLQTASDTASQDLYGVHTLSLTGLLLNSDSQSDAMADFLLSIYSEPEFRIAQIQVIVSTLTREERASILRLEIADLVTAVFTPSGVGDPFEQLSIVEGVSHDHMRGGIHVVTLNLGTVDSRAMFVLDDADFGTLNGPAVLAF